MMIYYEPESKDIESCEILIKELKSYLKLYTEIYNNNDNEILNKSELLVEINNLKYNLRFFEAIVRNLKKPDYNGMSDFVVFNLIGKKEIKNKTHNKKTYNSRNTNKKEIKRFNKINKKLSNKRLRKDKYIKLNQGEYRKYKII